MHAGRLYPRAYFFFLLLLLFGEKQQAARSFLPISRHLWFRRKRKLQRHPRSALVLVSAVRNIKKLAYLLVFHFLYAHICWPADHGSSAKARVLGNGASLAARARVVDDDDEDENEDNEGEEETD